MDNDDIQQEEPGFENHPDLFIETPQQSGDFPQWTPQGRKNPKWGEVRKQGLIIGRAPNQKIIAPDELFKLGQLGLNNKEIADWFGVDVDTLLYNFSAYLDKSRISLKIKLRRAMLNNAIQHNNAAVQIFLAKNMLGMRSEPTDGEDQQPLPWQD